MILISICMIVKNEQDNIRRCLDSLSVVMKKMSCELIIVDTGSEDNTVSICKEYTDQVFFHAWNGDFSEMRNISIRYATGEWILIMDADEEITELTELSEIFDKKINTIMFQFRNYTNTNDKQQYFDIISPRIFRNFLNFQYKGSVHNQPIFSEPTAIAKGIRAAHYGYDSSNMDLMVKKFIRTKSILELELNKNPDDLYFMFQLSVSYQMVQNFDKALEIIVNAYNRVSDFHQYYYIVKQYCISLKNLNMEVEAKEIFEKHKELVAKDVDMSYYFADTLQKNSFREESVRWYRNYLKLLEAFELRGEMFEPLSNMINTQNYKELSLIHLGLFYLSIGDEVNAFDSLKNVEVTQFTQELFHDYIRLLFEEKNIKLLQKIVNSLLHSNCDELKNIFLLEAYKVWSLGYIELEPFLTKMDSGIEMLFLLKKMDSLNQNYSLVELKSCFIKNYSIEHSYYSDFLYYIIKQEVSIYELLKDFTTNEIVQILELLLFLHPNIIEMIVKLLEEESNEVNFRTKIIIERFLLESMAVDSIIKEAVGIDYIYNRVYHLLTMYRYEILKEINNFSPNDEIYDMVKILNSLETEESFNKMMMSIKKKSAILDWYDESIHLREVYEGILFIFENVGMVI